MKTIELFESIYSKAGKDVEFPVITKDDVDKFHSLLEINSCIKVAFDETDSATSFYNAFPDIKKLIGTPIASEVFYAYKLGHFYTGIPNKLVYVLFTTFKTTDFTLPNLVIWKVSKELDKFADKIYNYEDKKFTVKSIIENVYGKSANIISESSYKCLNDGFYEVYISNVDRIAILPKDIGEALSDEDCRRLEYDKNKGIVLGDTPIRRLNGRLGITLDDFDLRGVI